MLTIRMQRTGRSGNAMFRVVVQDSRRTPTSGKVVALLGNYNPHAKSATLDKEKVLFYLEHGAQPSDRTARLLKAEGLKLPKWVEASEAKKGALRNPEKLRRNRPAEAPKPAEIEKGADEAIAEPAEPEEIKTEEPTDAEQA